jgi:hypothetical protein
MPSEVSICNQALVWVGANLITSLDDGSTEANICKANYASLRDAVLEDRDWTFATARKQLTPLADTPVFTWNYQMQLPSDMIRVIGCWPLGREEDREQADYVKEGRRILTNEPKLNIKYIRRVTPPEDFSAGFVQALAARIAADIAIPVTQSRSMQQDMQALYMKKLNDAGTNDGMQGRNQKKVSTKLTNSRV